MSNTVSNVTTGKPAITGAIWRAPLGTTLPADESEALGTAFKCLGYTSEDGVTNSNAPSVETIKAWGGDTVLMPFTERLDTWQWKSIEALNDEVLKMAYGDSNVTGSLATGLTVVAGATDQAAAVYVIDTIMTNGAKKTIVIPNGKLTNLGDIVYKDNDAVGYDVTISALAGGFTGSNATHKEYIKRA